MASRVLYLVSCDAPPAADLRELIRRIQRSGWQICPVLTPATERLLAGELTYLAGLTGYPVRTHCLAFGEPDPFPPPDALVAAPLTFNTLNKWAQGISDTAALGVLNECLGQDLPTVCLPYISRSLARHPAYIENVATLRRMAVQVHDKRVPGPDGVVPYRFDDYAELVLAALSQAVKEPVRTAS